MHPTTLIALQEVAEAILELARAKDVKDLFVQIREQLTLTAAQREDYIKAMSLVNDLPKLQKSVDDHNAAVEKHAARVIADQVMLDEHAAVLNKRELAVTVNEKRLNEDWEELKKAGVALNNAKLAHEVNVQTHNTDVAQFKTDKAAWDAHRARVKAVERGEL